MSPTIEPTPQPREVHTMHIMSLPRQDIAVDATVLPNLFELYLQTLIQERSLSELTIKSYRVQMSPFFEWFAQQDTTLLTPKALYEYTVWLRTKHTTRRGKHPSAQTYNHAITRLGALLKWCYKKDCVPVNMADWLPKLRTANKAAWFPDIADLQALFDATTGAARLRNWAVLALFLSTGARLFEIANATPRNLTFASDPHNLRTSDDHSGTLNLEKVKFDAKGEGEGRIVAFCTTTGLLLKVWLLAQQPEADEPIFGLKADGIDKMLRNTAERAKVPEFHPHALRRAFADYWDAHHGLDGMLVLKKQLGHSTRGDVTETHYLRHNKKRTAATLAKWHVSPMREIQIAWDQYPVHLSE